MMQNNGFATVKQAAKILEVVPNTIRAFVLRCRFSGLPNVLPP